MKFDWKSGLIGSLLAIVILGGSLLAAERQQDKQRADDATTAQYQLCPGDGVLLVLDHRTNLVTAIQTDRVGENMVFKKLYQFSLPEAVTSPDGTILQYRTGRRG